MCDDEKCAFQWRENEKIEKFHSSQKGLSLHSTIPHDSITK